MRPASGLGCEVFAPLLRQWGVTAAELATRSGSAPSGGEPTFRAEEKEQEAPLQSFCGAQRFARSTARSQKAAAAGTSAAAAFGSS